MHGSGIASYASAVAVVLLSTTDALAFKIDTHRLVNVQAAATSTLDGRLKEQFGFAGGLAERFDGKQVREWIRDGGAAEDQFLGFELLGAALRSRHHFHNPLLSWDQAGLAGQCLGVPLSGQASVRWAQDLNQGISGKASWGDARRRFYEALTLPSQDERNKAFARAFQILGQQMHLIADLAVPAHTRNDVHCTRSDDFEAWAVRRDNQQSVADLLAGTPIGPDPAITRFRVPIPDAIATVPIARLWDTDQYDRNNPTITTGRTIGLAEYTNANFFSDHTVFSTPDLFPFPASTSVDLRAVPEREPKTGELRRYFIKTRDGESIDHVAVPGALHAFLPDALKDRNKGLDDRVFQDYAAKLLPRAVGYSAVLLDHFFRGQLRAVPFWNRRGIRLDIQNLTSETMRGVFELHAIHQGGQQEKIAAFGTAAAPLTLGPFGRTEVGLPTTFTPAKRFALVFQGQLGDELPDAARDFLGAVAGVIFDVEFVFIVQDRFDGPMAQFKCGPRIFPPNPFSGVVRREILECTWLPRTVRIPGRFVTSAVDRPIIDEVRLFGGGSTTGQPRLIVDGVLQPGERWVRQDPTQPDPKTFVVEEAGIDSPGFYELDVQIRNRTVFETELTLINLGGSLVGKAHTTNGGSRADRLDLVMADRSVFSAVELEDSTRDWREAQFRTLEISGVPNPTLFSGVRRFGPLRPSGTFQEFSEGIRVDEDEYDQQVIDHFETLPEGTGAEAAYDALPGLADFVDPIPQAGPPDVKWTAFVRRDYRPTELQFFQLFQIEPIFYTIPLRGE